MAELEVGQHCDVEHCGQLDFLPFVCDSCSRVFCLTHRSRESHGCVQVPTAGSGGSGGNGGESEGSTQYPCSYKSCSGKELVQVLCLFCENHFCFRHRHQSDHECAKLEAPKPRMVATQQLVKEIVDALYDKSLPVTRSGLRREVGEQSIFGWDHLQPNELQDEIYSSYLGKVLRPHTDSKKSAPPSKVRRGAKNAETAAKVSLMKLKLHALGDKSLPQSERVYFQVYLPKGGKERSRPMFFCKSWSVGKVVDYAASIASLKNDNNKAAAKKLRVCHTETGETLPLDSSLEMWLSSSENPLYNGGTIIIEYMDNECSAIEDTSSYLI